MRKRARLGVATAGRFALFVLRRLLADRGLQVASALTYTSLLGLVPILSVVLAIFSAFPVFRGMRDQVKEVLLAPLMPDAGAQARAFIDQALANTQELTTFGSVGIGVTAILLLFTIERAFNQIWRVSDPRPLATRLLAFWSLLTLGPLLLGLGLSLSTDLARIAAGAGLDGSAEGVGRLLALGPFVLETVVFTLLYAVLPNRRVRLVHALAGGVAAAAAFEALKAGFGVYLGEAETYQKVYGALAAVPIFLAWLYLSWSVVLVGAELAAALPEWRESLDEGRRSEIGAGERFAAALALLEGLLHASRTGAPLDRDEAAGRLPVRAEALDAAADALRKSRYVVAVDGSGLVLSRNLETTTLYDLERAIGNSVDVAGLAHVDVDAAPWLSRLAEILRRVDDAKRARMSIPLSALLKDGDSGGAERGFGPHAREPGDAAGVEALGLRSGRTE